MLAALVPVTALLLGTALLLLGNGLLGTLLSLRATLDGFPAAVTGLVMAGYFAGFMAGSLLGVRLIERVGHIRTFAALAAVACTAALLHALFVEPLLWALLRGASGFAMAGLYMVIESWLNARATNVNRGQVLSIYMLVNLAALTVGQLLLNAGDPAGFVLFSLVAILLSLALVPVALTRFEAPTPERGRRLRLGALYLASPLGMVGCLATGIANGAFWSLGPAFASGVGLDTAGVSGFMALVVLGGALLQWPMGRLSDRYDRRTVITAVLFAAAATGLGLALLGGFAWALLPASLLFGGFALPLYSLCVAHVNDHLEPADCVPASSALLFTYGVGAIVGPVIAGGLMSLLGPAGLFTHTAVAYGLVGLFALYRMRQRPPPPSEAQGPFVSVPQTTPVVLELDPRSEAEPPPPRPD